MEGKFVIRIQSREDFNGERWGDAVYAARGGCAESALAGWIGSLGDEAAHVLQGAHCIDVSQEEPPDGEARALSAFRFEGERRFAATVYEDGFVVREYEFEF